MNFARYGRLCLIMSALISWSIAGCGHKKSASQIASELRSRLMPPGSSATDPAAPVRSESMISTDWEMDSSLSPDELEGWISTALRPEFAEVSSAPGILRYAVYADGESKRLEIRVKRAADVTAARIYLVIAAD